MPQRKITWRCLEDIRSCKPLPNNHDIRLVQLASAELHGAFPDEREFEWVGTSSNITAGDLVRDHCGFQWILWKGYLGTWWVDRALPDIFVRSEDCVAGEEVSPFVHVLLGVAHAWAGNGYEAIGTTIPSSGTTFATGLRGGIDIKLGHFIALRPIQIDYLLTRFNSATQNEPRSSAGLVVRF